MSDARTRTVTLPPALATRFESVRETWSQSAGTHATHLSTIKRVERRPGTSARPRPRSVSEAVTPGSADAGPSGADYALRTKLGEGGMGEVHLAIQTSLLRQVALKRLLASAAERPDGAEDFLTEALVTANLDHPNILPVHELGIDDAGMPFYTMKRVNGRPWSERMAEMDQTANLETLLKVCEAVAYAHNRGVLHRDLKPANVMLGDYGEVLVMDWGLAAAVPDHEQSLAPVLPETVAVGGTPAYLAPEMALGDGTRIGVRSDVYLLGAILFEIINGEPPHDGKNAVDCIRNAAGNLIVDGRGGPLAEIAATAMASDPEDRHPHVWAFRRALSDHLQHRESTHLTQRAGERLDRAVDSGDYQSFARALFGFEEALELWPGNARAHKGRQEARWAYAACALDKGDLDLAASLIEFDPTGLEDLEQQLSEHRRQRDRSQKAARRLKQVQETIRRESARDWQILAFEDFSDSSWRSRWEARGGNCAWHAGGLHMWNGNPQILLMQASYGGDLRISFQARIDGDRPSDISCFLCAAPTSDDNISLHENGYEFKYGAFENTRNVIYKCGKALWEQEAHPLTPGHTYHVVAERVGTQLRWWVDGSLIAEIEDADGLTGEHHNRLGLVGWRSDYTYTELLVERLGAPIKADLLEVAQDHLLRGHISTALHLFEDVAAAAGDPDRRQQAEEGVERARELRSLATRIPGYQRRIHQVWPDARVTLVDYHLMVDLNLRHIRDLDALRGMPIRRLSAYGNRIEDLSFCEGMPLQELTLSNNEIRQLDPLRGLPLTVLRVDSNRIRRLAPLEDVPLRELSAAHNRLADLSPLRNLELEQVDLSDNEIVDIEALVQPHLRSCDLSDNRITSLPDISGMQLTELHLSGNRLTHLPALPKTLTHLAVQDNSITDLSPLRSVALERLDCRGNPLTNLDALLERPPQALLVGDCPLTDDALERAEEAWSRHPHTRPLAHQMATLRAWRQQDIRQLRRLARRVGHQRVCFIDDPCTWAEANRRATACGGSLPVLLHEWDQDDLVAILPPTRRAWIGLHQTTQGATWVDGSPRSHYAFVHQEDAGRSGVVASDENGWHLHEDSQDVRLAWFLAFDG